MIHSIWLLQSVALVDLFAASLIIPLIANHVRSLGAGHVYVGLMTSIYNGFQLASGPLIGSYSDLKGRKSTLIATLLICSLAYFGLGQINSLVVIIIMRVILGLFKQTQTLTSALVPDYEGNKQKQSEIFGKMAALSGIGMTIGPVIGGHLAEEYPGQAFTLISAIVGGCFITNAGLIYILPITKSDVKKKTTQTEEKKLSASLMQKIQNACEQSVLDFFKIDWSKYGVTFLFKGLIEFTILLFYSNYTLYLKTVYGLTPRYIGYIISFQGIIRAISSYFIGFINSYYTKDKNYSERNFHVFLALSLSILGLISSFNIYVYALFLIPLGISFAVGKLVSLEMLLKVGQVEHRGTLIGASNSMRSLSGVIAPIVSGFIGQYFGVPYVVFAAFFASALGCFVSYLYSNKIKNLVKKD